MDGFLARLLIATVLVAGLRALPAAASTAASAEPPANGAAAPQTPESAEAAAAVEKARRGVADSHLSLAIAQLAAYVAAHPKEEAPAIYLGDLYYRASDMPAAEATYLAVLKADPDNHQVHDRLGGIYAAMDRAQDAIAQFSLSLPLTAAYGHLVQIHRRIGDFDEFEQGYVQTVRESPFNAGALFALGAILSADHRSAEALSYLQRAVVLEPKNCAVLSEVGDASLDVHDVDQATGFFQRCLAQDPNDYASLVGMADAAIDVGGRDSEATRTLQRAESQDPDRPDAFVDLGYIKDDQGDWSGAVADYLHAAALDPFERDAYVNLGFDYMSHQLYPLAEAALLKGLSVSPGDGRLHYLLGLTYERQGKRDLARGEFRLAVTGNEPDVVRAAHEGLATL